MNPTLPAPSKGRRLLDIGWYTLGGRKKHFCKHYVEFDAKMRPIHIYQRDCWAKHLVPPKPKIAIPMRRRLL